jgi:hypothetical protein
LFFPQRAVSPGEGYQRHRNAPHLIALSLGSFHTFGGIGVAE